MYASDLDLTQRCLLGRGSLVGLRLQDVGFALSVQLVVPQTNKMQVKLSLGNSYALFFFLMLLY